MIFTKERPQILRKIRKLARKQKEFRLLDDLMEPYWAQHQSGDWIEILKYLVKRGELSVEPEPWKRCCPVMTSNIYKEGK